MIKTAVVLVGGKGTRMKPLTESVPKPLVEVAGKPILYWIINWLKSYGIDHVVLAAAYKKEKIEEFIKENNSFGIKIEISENSIEGGTAEAFRKAISNYVKDENFLAMNGDELTNMNIGKIVEKHNSHNSIVTMALAPFHCKFSVVKFGEQDSQIGGFDYAPKLPNVPISIGIYVFNRKILDFIPPMGSIEDMVFTWLAKEHKMTGYMLLGKEEWTSVNTEKDIGEATEKLKEWGTLSKY